jgi:hypothetical protein
MLEQAHVSNAPLSTTRRQTAAQNHAAADQRDKQVPRLTFSVNDLTDTCFDLGMPIPATHTHEPALASTCRLQHADAQLMLCYQQALRLLLHSVKTPNNVSKPYRHALQ